jgi:hypothetical protein
VIGQFRKTGAIFRCNPDGIGPGRIFHRGLRNPQELAVIDQLWAINLWTGDNNLRRWPTRPRWGFYAVEGQATSGWRIGSAKFHQTPDMARGPWIADGCGYTDSQVAWALAARIATHGELPLWRRRYYPRAGLPSQL